LLCHAAGRVERHPFGEALHTDELPSAWVLNQLVVDAEDVGAEELVAALDAAYGHRRHRRALVERDELGVRLAPELRDRGWQAERDVYQVLRDGGDLRAAPGLAHEVDQPTLREIERRTLAEGSQASDDVVEQLLDMRAAFIRAGNGRCFAGVHEGVDAAHATLYSDGVIAQVEDVGTIEAHRGHGLGRAVVVAASEAALARGHELVFMMADDDDWPKRLYERIGYEVVGASWAFTLPDASAPH
jgi:GNAT superfamily N-acetyltransferase